MAKKKEKEKTEEKAEEETKEEVPQEEAVEEAQAEEPVAEAAAPEAEEPKAEAPAASAGGFGDRQMFPATCAECGKETEVPFKPDENRPVYCRDCYMKRRKPRGRY